jgi:segregation and condensation protein B
MVRFTSVLPIIEENALSEQIQLKRIIEGAIMAAEQPLSIEQLTKLFDKEEALSAQEVKKILMDLTEDYRGRGIQLQEVASGYRFQACQDLSPWLQRLWQERPVKYSRAVLETLALIVYQQPITRAEIEDIRGVAVSKNIMKTLMEREWVKIIGHKEAPGKPALFATTKRFLDDFNLKSLSELPPLAALKNLEMDLFMEAVE